MGSLIQPSPALFRLDANFKKSPLFSLLHFPPWFPALSPSHLPDRNAGAEASTCSWTAKLHQTHAHHTWALQCKAESLLREEQKMIRMGLWSWVLKERTTQEIWGTEGAALHGTWRTPWRAMISIGRRVETATTRRLSCVAARISSIERRGCERTYNCGVQRGRGGDREKEREFNRFRAKR